MVAAKKVMVIGIMAVLASSVLVGAISLYKNSSTSSATIKGNDDKTELNAKVNSVVDFCIKSLPNGRPDCDSQLRDTINQLCIENNEQLDACTNGKVGGYYKTRQEATTKSNNNTY
jgi:hypothetical protein